jgi:hypothetical protein
MISKVEYIRKVGNLKMYVNKNSFVRDIPMPIDSLLFSFWRCGYVEFSLPSWLVRDGIESIYSRHREEDNICEPSRVIVIIEKIIDGAFVHGGITFCHVNHDSKKITLGFDCNHYQDTKGFIKEPRSLGYCKTNLISLSKAVLKVKKNYRRYLIEQKIEELRKR